MRFTWDPRKAESNLRKHRVSFKEASTALVDPLGRERQDALDPSRTIVVCMSERGRLLLCVYVEREEGEVRIISARCLTKKERADHEEGQ